MIEIKKIRYDNDLQQALRIRRTVFVNEQHCPPELEWAHDDEAVHFLALADGVPAGAARWRKTENGYKLERFAVLKEYRKMGVGGALIQAVLADLPKDGGKYYLNAQLDAMPLYARFGFRPAGEEFMEAGIRHRQMQL